MIWLSAYAYVAGYIVFMLWLRKILQEDGKDIGTAEGVLMFFIYIPFMLYVYFIQD